MPHAKLALLDPTRPKRPAVEALAWMTNRDISAPHDVPKYVGRLVFHPDELSEKSRIFEEGLDDCAVELMKLRIKEQLIGDDPLFETVTLYFDRVDGDLLFFDTSGCEDGEITALKTLYEQAVVDFMAHSPMGTDFVVDERWAQDTFPKLSWTKPSRPTNVDAKGPHSLQQFATVT